jgi:predicted dehydrogenase
MRRVFDDKDVDAVLICTRTLACAGNIWACQAGKDVYVEKNISLTIPEGRKMIEAGRKYKRIIQCGFQNRSGAYNISRHVTILKAGSLAKLQ